MVSTFDHLLPLLPPSVTATKHHDVPPALSPAKQPLPNPFVAIITGASRGIGAETAKLFAQAGATGLVLTARKVESLEKTKAACQAVAKHPDIRITVLAADAGSTESAQIVADAVSREHGRLDVLINNAGLVSTHASAFDRFEDIQDDQFTIPMNVNYVGRALLIKRTLPLLLSSENGARAIVNISSVASHLVDIGAPGFNISEVACNRLSEVVAARYAAQDVVCYAVHPGTVFTTPPPGMNPEWARGSPDQPQLCGAFLLWLVREKRDWLSGRYLDVGWDVDELVAKREEIVREDKLKVRMAF